MTTNDSTISFLGVADGAVLVVGFDRSPAGHEALRVAGGLAHRMNASLRVVHVAELRDYPVDPDAADFESEGEAALEETESEARSTLDGWPGHWVYEARRGDPVRALLAAAEDAGALMIVVGSTERGVGSALQHLLGALPSVAERLRRGSVPVLAVPVSATEH